MATPFRSSDKGFQLTVMRLGESLVYLGEAGRGWGLCVLGEEGVCLHEARRAYVHLSGTVYWLSMSCLQGPYKYI